MMFLKICKAKQKKKKSKHKSLRFSLKNMDLQTFCSLWLNMFVVIHSTFMTLTWPDGSCHRSCLSLRSDIGSLSSLLAFCFRTHWRYFIGPEPIFFAGSMGATVKALKGPSFFAAPSALYQPWRLSQCPCVACGTPSPWKLWDTVFPVADAPCSVSRIIPASY